MAQQIVILGGGFGGLYAAKRLERRLRRQADVEVTLVSDAIIRARSGIRDGLRS